MWTIEEVRGWPTMGPGYEDRVARVLVLTVEQTGCPMDLPYDQTGAWLRDWCCRHNGTYYARPRESFSIREAREQAVRENKNTVIVDVSLS